MNPDQNIPNSDQAAQPNNIATNSMQPQDINTVSQQPIASQPAPSPVLGQQVTQPTPVGAQPQQPLQPSPVGGAQFSSSAPKAKSNNTKIIIVAVVIGGLLVVGAIGFAVMSATSQMRKKSEAVLLESKKKYSEEPTKNSDNKEVSDPAVAALSGPGLVKLSNKTIVDPEMGYTLTAKTLDTKSFSIPAKFASAQSGKTAVAVEYELKDTNKYYGSAKNTILTLVTADGTNIAPTTSLYEDQLVAKGLTSIDKAKETNDTVSGWDIYHVPTNKIDKLTLRYKRLAASVLGNDKTTIPTKVFEIPLQ